MPSFRSSASFNFLNNSMKQVIFTYLSNVNQPGTVSGMGDTETNDIDKDSALMELAFQVWIDALSKYRMLRNTNCGEK